MRYFLRRKKHFEQLLDAYMVIASDDHFEGMGINEDGTFDTNAFFRGMIMLLKTCDCTVGQNKKDITPLTKHRFYGIKSNILEYVFSDKLNVHSKWVEIDGSEDENRVFINIAIKFNDGEIITFRQPYNCKWRQIIRYGHHSLGELVKETEDVITTFSLETLETMLYPLEILSIIFVNNIYKWRTPKPENNE